MKTFLALAMIAFMTNVHAYDLSKKFGVGAGLGYAIPVFGNQFNSTADADWNMAFYGRYHFNPFLGIDLGVSKSEFQDTSMNFRNIDLKGLWRLAGASNLTPVVGAGVALTDIKDYNPGSAKLSLLANAGVDYGFTECLSLTGLLNYQYVSKFMGDMPGSRDHVIIPQLALNYYFGGENKMEKKEVEKTAEKPAEAPIEQPLTTTASATKRIDETAVIVEFNSSKAGIKTHYMDAIKAVAEQMKDDSTLVGVIQGRADSTGPKTFNQKLSEQRALNVKKAFLDLGISEERLKVEAFGESNPVADNKTKEGRQRNRSAYVNLTNTDTLM